MRAPLIWGFAAAAVCGGCAKGAATDVAPITAATLPVAAPAPKPGPSDADPKYAEPQPRAESSCWPRHIMERAEPKSSKRELVEAFLREEGGMANVTFDTKRVGVKIPAYLKRDAAATLAFGYEMAVPIPDLVVDGDGFSGTFSFMRQPFFCRVPWSAVFVVGPYEGDEDGTEHTVYPRAVPEAALCPKTLKN